MNAEIVYRGPDSEGVYSDETVGLGIRRLTIIDLSRNGDQPHYNESGSVISVCNGEIYNYLELKRELIQRGHQFVSENDAEVIPHLYEEYGERFVDHLNGMFAITLFDRTRNVMIAVRDRSGIKPLYYYYDRHELYLASSIHSIKAVQSLTINSEHVGHYLFYQYYPGEVTPYLNLWKLAPATMLKYDGESLTRSEYWKPELSSDQTVEDSEVFYRTMVEAHLERSVVGQVQSDVPVGIMLSGGIDSSLIAYYASRMESDNLSFFHVSMEGNTSQDQICAETFARWLGIDLTQYNIDHASLSSLIPTVMGYMDEPIADTAAISSYLISHWVQEFTPVLLSGVGGDELFGGYGRYVRGVEQGVDQFYKQVPFFSVDEIGAMTGVGFDPNRFITGLDDEVEDRANHLMWIDLNSWLSNQLLNMQDKMSMANSVEMRVPFLDHELVEFALGMPSEYKMGRSGKALLKNIMSRIYLSSYADRQKAGFGVPIAKWVMDHYPAISALILHESKMVEQFGLTRSEVSRILTQDHRLQINRIWILYVLALWTAQQ